MLAEFGDVGLMTGDVTINPSASCLVMTTEILRSMLYRGSEVMREVAWVIFDEVHYMRDKVRGVVWEETIILLPDKVHYVFLSATIPNAMQFAEWICKTHKQPCHVVYTDFRPTPLQHYLFPSGGDGIHLAVDEKGVFREDNFQRAIAALGDSNDDKRSKGKGNFKEKQQKAGSDLLRLVKMIMAKNYHPVIVFSFSKRECENNALALSKLDFNDSEEKEMVISVFQNAVHSLNEDDRNLPQIQHILPLLTRGIGIHHSGLLPILKEVIEILFQEGLLKVLFATETFSIGLNMPAKTVMFTSVRKFDGNEQRWLGSGEYIQMSGRAGRRGLDDRGIVILMFDEKMEPDVCKGMLKGEADRLNSAFHLTYSMILNLMRVEGVSPEYMLERCFHQFQSTANVPTLETDLRIYERRREEFEIPNESNLQDYHELRTQLDLFQQDARDVINHPTYCIPFLQPGRMIRICVPPALVPDGQTRESVNFGWGIVVSFQLVQTRSDTPNIDLNEKKRYVVDVMLFLAPPVAQPHARMGDPKRVGGVFPVPATGEIEGELHVVPCTLEVIDAWSSIVVNLPGNVKLPEGKKRTLLIFKEIKKRFPDGIPLLDPITDMGVKDEAFVKLIKKIELFEKRLNENPVLLADDFTQQYESYLGKLALKNKIKEIRQSIQDAVSVAQMDELKARKRVLRRLEYTSENDIIEVKGRVACEISSGDELLLTEMIFNGVFRDLTVNQCVALLSCFCYDERKNEEQPKLKEELEAPLRIMKESAKHIVKICVESRMEIDEKEYIDSFNPGLMDVVYSWVQGAKFEQIMKMTTEFEGTIIRVMRRLEELLRQMSVASKAIGNTELETKFADVLAD
ncbi:ATP-dependent RNA helicase mtr4, partial [Nowakowskiella sp. JEL0078]